MPRSWPARTRTRRRSRCDPLIAYGDELRDGWLFDLDYALVWASELLEPPSPGLERSVLRYADPSPGA